VTYNGALYRPQSGGEHIIIRKTKASSVKRLSNHLKNISWPWHLAGARSNFEQAKENTERTKSMKHEMAKVQESPVRAATLGYGGTSHRSIAPAMCRCRMAIGGTVFAQGIGLEGRDSLPHQRRRSLCGVLTS
jgi:hypothetical protein